MMYTLKRLSDGHGSSGPASVGIRDVEGSLVFEGHCRPAEGLWMRVGTPNSTSFEDHDWWQTSKVREVLEESRDSVRFKTAFDEYLWEKV